MFRSSLDLLPVKNTPATNSNIVFDIAFMPPMEYPVPEIPQDLNGQLTLSCIAEERGYQTTILNPHQFKSLNYESYVEALISYLLTISTRAIAFYTVGHTFHTLVYVAERLKSAGIQAKLIFAGPHSSPIAHEVLEAYSFIDAIAIGEGELVISNILEALRNGNLIGVRGLASRSETNKIVSNKGGLIEVLDKLPTPLKLKRYMQHNPYGKEAELDAGRGCPYLCTFCSTNEFWEKSFRIKSVDRLLADIREYVEMGSSGIIIGHDNFASNRSKLRKFCLEFIKAYPERNIPWGCNARADNLREEEISLLQQANCQKVLIGIETGSSRLQKQIKKRLNIEKSVQTISHLLNAGISCITTLIVGFPHETLDDIKSTLYLYNRLKKMGAQVEVHLFRFFPGSALYNEYKPLITVSHEVNASPDWVKDLVSANPHFFPYYSGVETPLTKECDKLAFFLHEVHSGLQQVYRYTFQYWDERPYDLFELYQALRFYLPNAEKLEVSLLVELGDIFYQHILSQASIIDRAVVTELYELDCKINEVKLDASQIRDVFLRRRSVDEQLKWKIASGSDDHKLHYTIRNRDGKISISQRITKFVS